MPFTRYLLHVTRYYSMNIFTEIRKKWKPRDRRSHKGDFGRILIVAGSRGMAGAAHLAGQAALRAGAGLVGIAVPDAVYHVVARRQAELMVWPFPSTRYGTFALRCLKKVLDLAQKQDVLAVGPGLSQNPETQKFIRSFLRETKQPFVLDADGLNAFGGHLKELTGVTKDRAILTPHPGEFMRLFRGKLMDQDAARKKRVRDIADRFRCVVVLKGHHTAAASPDGKIYINQTGNPGMATGGTGDVLTGILAAFVGQRFSLWDAARFGVALHGLAGDLAAKEKGEVSLIAGDLIEYLPKAIKEITGR